MTAKRFKFNGMTNCIEYDGKSILLDSYGEDIEELLNELHEENQDLHKKEVELGQNYLRLLEENEQLKQRNNRFEEKIQRERRVSVKQHLKWSKEAENKIKELSKENEQLKKELLFFYDVANCECSTNWKEDMEKGCKRFFNCTYEEAKEKYGDYDGMWWEIND